jgi:hypothetical protein
MIVGQKVVCVDDRFPPQAAQYYLALPKKDVTYVIRNVELGVNWQGEAGEVCLLLVGLHNPRSDKPPHRERGFNAERFRPLDETTTRETEEVADCIGSTV